MTLHGLSNGASDRAIPIWAVEPAGLAEFLSALPDAVRACIAVAKFDASPGKFIALGEGPDGRAGFLAGAAGEAGWWGWAELAGALPAGDYALQTKLDAPAATAAAIGWCLGSYRFGLRKTAAKPLPLLHMPENADRAIVARTLKAVFLGRDLINQPANRLGPAELADAVVGLAGQHGADVKLIVGDELVAANLPAIHTVGASSHRPPRLVELLWGDPGAPKVTLVGKGVCFDTGGLNLKTMADMKTMKRDMGGAAVVIALASMVMDAGLPVRLRLLVAAVDNILAPDAFRPGDIVMTRSGITAEITNTDCEGRLVLADALAFADEQEPDLIIDVATLTGSARVALGGEIGALFSNDAALGSELQNTAVAVDDPLWMLPLWKPYRSRIAAPVGDILNMADGAYAGAITAALFLNEFVTRCASWTHLDVSAWNDRSRPGRPVGGEVTGAHALFRFLSDRYGNPAARSQSDEVRGDHGHSS